MPRYLIQGHAIVSADDRIADANGRTPPELRNEADWARFQAALDRTALTILGRVGHEANPNIKGRNRLVLSSSARGIERRPDAWWWNPAEASLDKALARAAPLGGIVAVPGGRRVFDLFLDIGFDEFHLARAERVFLPDGVPIFSEILAGVSATGILSRSLEPGEPDVLDADAGVTMTIWSRRHRQVD
jgi:hypothetical protein